MRWGAYLAIAIVALAGCGPAAPKTGLAHKPDDSVQVGKADSAHLPRIVSLNPCVDAVLVKIADAEQILALSHYSHDPRATSVDLAQARRFRVTGGTIEEILALSPDLVVAGSFMPASTVAALERLGIRVERIGMAHNVPESLSQLEQIAQLAGQEEHGAKLASLIRQAVAQATPPAGHRPVPAAIWQSGGIVPGRDQLISDLLVRTGFLSHSAQRGMGQAEYLSLENMLADPPELILTAGTPGEGEDRMLAHPALDVLAGVRKVRLDPALLYCGGPTIIQAVARLAQLREGAELQEKARLQEGVSLQEKAIPQRKVGE